MIRFSEYVSPGHPDKIADYISQYLLDRYIENDPLTRYAVEVQIKDNIVTLGGEISSTAHFNEADIITFVRDAVSEIGYTKEYQDRWGKENTICGDDLQVCAYISEQSRDIAQGVPQGWGDQGIFFGMFIPNKYTYGMPFDHHMAKCICKNLFDSQIGGLDIKTQVVLEDKRIKKIIVALPLLDEALKPQVEEIVRNTTPGLEKDYEIIINGTGRYVQHSSIADCGTTGRKLTVDFYGGNCTIGGGSPWTKDATKADLTLNLMARKLAIRYGIKHDCPAYVKLACSIGSNEVDIFATDNNGVPIQSGKLVLEPERLRTKLGLDKPIYASMCRWGLFGRFQRDKAWEKFK